MRDMQEMVLSISSSSEDEEEEGEVEPYQSVSSDNVPWPAILQYLRESESESSKYFSLQTPQAATEQYDKEEAAIQYTDTARTTCQFCEQFTKPLSLLPDSLEKVYS